MHFNHISFLEYNNSTALIQKGGKISGWFTYEEKISKMIQLLSSVLITSPLYNKGNALIIIDITFIEIFFHNYYTHILHGLPKRYMYGYLI